MNEFSIGKGIAIAGIWIGCGICCIALCNTVAAGASPLVGFAAFVSTVVVAKS